MGLSSLQCTHSLNMLSLDGEHINYLEPQEETLYLISAKG